MNRCIASNFIESDTMSTRVRTSTSTDWACNVMLIYRNDIVVWVSIVRNQDATNIITGKFDLVSVNNAHRDHN